MGLTLIKLEHPTIIGRRTALGWRSAHTNPNLSSKPVLNHTGTEFLKALVVDDRGEIQPWRAVTIAFMATAGSCLIATEAAPLLSFLPSHSHEIIDKVRDKAPILAAKVLVVAVFSEIWNFFWKSGE